MALATLFPMSVYLMLALASCILMYAEAATFPAFLTVPIAFVGYLFSERKPVVVLSGWLANLLGLAALLLAAQEFFASLEGRLLSGAHLLVYLSWLVMFLPKTRQHYWWAIALSLLQVAVSAVLTKEIGYGLFLVLFALISIWTVSLFTMFMAYRDELEDEQTGHSSTETGMSRRLNPHHVEVASGQVLFGMPSRSIGGVEYDPHAKWVGIRFAGRAAGILMFCLAIGLTFFLCIPRLWSDINPFEDETLGPIVTGFSQKVRLGQMGSILESRQPALAVTIYEGDSEKRVPIETYLDNFEMDEPYFRGNVMDNYSHGNWTTTINYQMMELKFDSIHSDSFYRQHVELEPLGTQQLFLIHPFWSINIQSPKDDVWLAPIHFTLMREHKRNNAYPMVYDVYSRKRNPNSRGARPQYFDLVSRLPDPSRRDLERLFLQFPKDDLSKVQEYTLQIAGLKASDLPLQNDDDRDAVAQRVLSHLRDSGEFSYSLKSEVLDPKVDPLEDFLFNRKQGHCEYYASALALMLRSVGIPTRLISGYKGGTTDPETGVLNVQQRHAHAWTEAYYDNHWHTMDATPGAAREEVVEAAGKLKMSWTELKERMKSHWSRYIVSMNYNYQSRNIYRFSMADLKSFWNSLGGTLTRWGTQIVEFIKHPERWFSLRGGVTAFILLTFLTSLGFAGRWLVRKLRLWFEHASQERIRRRQIEFYEQFLRLCEERHLVKHPTQTPREFSRQVERSWNQLLTEHGWQTLPATLVDKFYAVRFGDEPLPEADEQELLSTLQKLEQVMKQSANGRSKVTSA